MNALTRARKELSEVASKYAIRKAIREILLEHTDELEEMLRQQLMEGKMPGSRGREKKMTPRYRNELYAKKKASMNPVPGYKVPDLKLTGSLHKSITARINATSASFEVSDPDDEKMEYILRHWGQAFNLSRERWKKFTDEVVAPKLKAKILQRIKR